MIETDMKSFNEKIIEEFRANGGKVGMFADYPMVVLHTIGAKSGKPHLVPLVLTINEENEWILLRRLLAHRPIPPGSTTYAPIQKLTSSTARIRSR